MLIRVYIPPSADQTAACDTNHTVARILSQHPEAFVAITLHFKHVNLDCTLLTFHQFGAPQGEMKHWTCMQMLKMHTEPLPSPH